MRSEICVIAIFALLVVGSSGRSRARAETVQPSSSLGKCEVIRDKLAKYQSVCKKIIQDRRRHIQIYDNLARNLQFNNTHLQSTIIEHAATIISRNDLLVNCEREAKEREKKLCSLGIALNSTLIQLRESNETVAALSSQNALLESELSEKKAEIDKQNETIDALSTLVGNQNSSVLELKQANMLQLKELADHQNTINMLQAELVRSNAAVEALGKQNDELRAQLSASNASIKHLNELVEGYGSCCQASSCVAFGASNTVHMIQVSGVPDPFQVLCNSQLAGNGWTVIQRRINGEVDFYRSWDEYKRGFGNVTGEFFIGLERLHHMTKDTPQQLYVWLEDFSNNTRYASFDDFKIGSEQEAYALLSLGKHQGTVGDAMRMNRGQKFTTFDQDNDADEVNNCAELRHGAWWYDHCGYSNLNGFYAEADLEYDYADKGIFWADDDFHESDYSLKSVIMMIRPKVSKETL